MKNSGSAPGPNRRLVALLLALVPAGASVAAHAQDAAQAPAATAGEVNPTFDILEYRVLGSTVLEPKQIETAVYPFLGPGKTLADIQQAREALAGLYRDGGYGAVSVDIPEQSVAADGIVRLAVTEGRVDRVEVKGARYFSKREIRSALPSIEHGNVPNLTAFQSELVVLGQETADRSVTPTLRAGRAPGLVDVTLNVKDDAPLHGSLEVNDRATADTSRTRVSATISYDYLFGKPQSFSVQYQTAPEAPKEVKSWSFSWTDRLGGDDSWVAYFVDSKSDVAALGTLSVLGNGRVAGLRRNFGVVSEPSESFTANFGVDYKDFGENIFTQTAESETPIRYAVWSGGAGGFLQTDHWRLDANGSVVFGMRGLVNDEDKFADKRYRAHASFAYLRGQMRLSHELPLGLSASLRLTGQYSPAPVISNEQFSLGGVDTVRGYLEAEALTDTGAAGSFELGSPRFTFGSGSSQRPFALSTFLFYDAGIGSLEFPLPGQDRSTELRSYGAGMLFSGPMHMDATLDWARAISQGSRTNAQDSRVHFQFKVGF